MGGCAGKFKGSDDLPPEPLPSDAPVNPDQADQGETVAKEKEVGETKAEAPLVDVSEEKKEVEKPAEPASPAAPAAAVAAAEPEKKDETPVAKSEEKVEAVAAPEKKEETPVAKETEKKESEVAPAKEANKETPLVKV